MGNETDLPIHEHATDTRGATLVTFGLFDKISGSSTRAIQSLHALRRDLHYARQSAIVRAHTPVKARSSAPTRRTRPSRHGVSQS
ncbi:hypothetical protein AB0J28_11745 [Streptosporangium canum]|uniref:hypothetical protein n=1 Tax=Streptosporangium canum TaxID=324952 RepID=UPI003446BD57